MRGRLLISGAFFALVALAGVPSALAAPPTTGIRLTLYTIPAGCVGPSSFPASTPFYVNHGWSVADWKKATPMERASLTSSGTYFILFVDGVQTTSTQYYTIDHSTDTHYKWDLTNFPNGLAGTHTLSGEWFNQGALIFTCTSVVAFS